ncbi:MAG: D-alanyl-D-alanine carboxypeptidase family protein [Clostridia bacterium]|nr:D-alanyl-D-alanine carboxypeptidase family protein [Clostridia bacterium]
MFKKLFLSLFFISVFLFGSPTSSFNTITALETTQISAESAILVCADSMSVIFKKNEKHKLSMASTTKIMTAVLALEQAEKFDKPVKITSEMITVEGSSMGLCDSDMITLENLSKGMLATSGNDAANSIAMAVGENKDNFVKMMNDKALKIGMKDTNFVTPSGLDDQNHYSTAYDMALLGRYAMKNQKFCNIVSQKKVSVDFINPKKTQTYSNHNKLLSLYDGCVGIKTGFTKKSGRCLVSCAQRNGVSLIAVTLNAPDDWNDHIKMYDYGFDNIENIVFDDTNSYYEQDVVGSDKNFITVKPKNSISATTKKDDSHRVKKTLKLPPFSYAPININDTLGYIEYTLDGVSLGEVELVAQDTLTYAENNNIFDAILKYFNLK